MGVRHLITFLRPYATSEALAGKQLVIDGPAFAYHIYHIALQSRGNATSYFEAVPSYNVLADTAITWLDGLRASNAVM
jgi:hypothetical protein